MLKPTARKDIKGRINGYVIDAAGVRAEGATAKEAQEEWQRNAEQQGRSGYVSRFDLLKDGSIGHLFYRDGWEYEFIRADGMAPGQMRTGGVSILGRITYPEALEKYLRHMAQYNDMDEYSGVRAYDRAHAA